MLSIRLTQSNGRRMVEKEGYPQTGKQVAILKAAQRRFAQFGHSKVTMDEIAADVGMGKASLYYYYPTKEDLFRAVIDHEQAEFLALMEPILSEESSSAEKLRRYLAQRMQYFHDFVNLSSLSMSVFTNTDSVMGELFRILTKHDYRMIESILSEGVRRNEFSPIDVNATAGLVVHLLQGLRLRLLKRLGTHVYEEDYAELKRDQELLSALLVRGLCHTYHDGNNTNESTN